MSTDHLQAQLEKEIDERFGRKQLKPEAVAEIARVSDSYRVFAQHIAKTTPAGRELQTALTKLEEAKFFTNQAIARNGAAE